MQLGLVDEFTALAYVPLYHPSPHAVGLAKAQVLAVNFVGILVVRRAIQYHFEHFRLRVSDVRHAFRGHLNGAAAISNFPSTIE